MSEAALAPSAPRPIGRTQALRSLTGALDVIVESYDDPSVVARRAGLVLRSALANPDLLEVRHCEPWADSYRAHGDDPYLVERATADYLPGSVSVLVPPNEDVHRVENAGDRLAISLHLYGDDISVLGSSINRTFGDELVRPAAGVTDLRRSWRASISPPDRATLRWTNIRGRHGFDVVGSPGELQAEDSGRPP